MTARAPKPMKPHDFAVIARQPDATLLVRDTLTGDLKQMAGIGRPLTPLEAHLCGEEAHAIPC